MNKPKLADREAALIEAARRELAARASPAAMPQPAPESGSGSGLRNAIPAAAPPAAGPDIAEHIAALMQAEKEQTLRRKKRLRRYGIVIPAVFLIAAVLWLAAAIVRYFRT